MVVSTVARPCLFFGRAMYKYGRRLQYREAEGFAIEAERRIVQYETKECTVVFFKANAVFVY